MNDKTYDLILLWIFRVGVVAVTALLILRVVVIAALWVWRTL